MKQITKQIKNLNMRYWKQNKIKAREMLYFDLFGPCFCHKLILKQVFLKLANSINVE